MSAPKLTAEVIAELRKLEQEATSGPWRNEGKGLQVRKADASMMNICDIRGWGYLTGKGHFALGLDDEEARVVQNANAELIAALRNAAPSLLDAAEERDRLRDECERLREALAEIASTYPRGTSANRVAREALAKGDGDG